MARPYREDLMARKEDKKAQKVKKAALDERARVAADTAAGSSTGRPPKKRG
jgi:hypothetical protein